MMCFTWPFTSYVISCLTILRILAIYWSFDLLVPLIEGCSAMCCFTGLMAFLHLDLPLARLIFKCFLRKSALTTSFHLHFGLPQDVCPSTSTLMLSPPVNINDQTASAYSIWEHPWYDEHESIFLNLQ